MATPVHTGASVFLSEYNARTAADVFVIGTTAVLVLAATMRPNAESEPTDYRLEIRHGYWNKQAGVVVVPTDQLRVPEAEEDRWFEAGYRLTERRTPVLD